ncbi:MAG TPA: pilus assembly protein TadG-related protein [Herpetosiphonaceae bacterium]
MKRLIRMQEGQSILLIALLLVILIAFVGLTVDTGKAFSRQRTLSAGSNASANAGMNSVVMNMTDSQVLDTVKTSLTSNNSETFQQISVGQSPGTDKDTVYFSAEYLNAEGEFIDDVGAQPGSRPLGRGVTHVRVRTYENVSTTFSKIVGKEDLPVSAAGAAGRANCVQGVFPITFHEDSLNGPPAVRPMPNPYADVGAVPNYSRFKISRGGSVSGAPGNFLWLTWNPSNQSQTALEASLMGAGNLSSGFTEATPPASDPAAQRLVNGRMEVGDWVSGNTGNVTSVDDELNWHIANKTQMILPLHNAVAGSGSNGTFRISRFVTVRLLSYSLTGNDKHFMFGLVKTETTCVINTQPEYNEVRKFTFRIRLDEKLQWFNPAARPKSYDIAIVADYSGSMRECYSNHNQCGESSGLRRIDYQTPVLTRFVNEMLVVRNGQGADNRLAFVRFGVSSGGKNVAVSEISFADSTATALTKFRNLIGTAASPRRIPNSEISGGTPTATGLATSIPIFQATRRYVDANGQPVNLAVLLLTDGLANVFLDEPHKGYQNSASYNPFRCQSTVPGVLVTDDPYAQATCPAANHPSNPGGRIRPPIIAAIDMGNQLRALSDPGRNSVMKIYAVLLGQPNGMTPEDLRLNQMADATYAANSPSQLDAMIAAITNELGRPCVEGTDPLRPSAGTTVTITRQGESIPAWQGTTNTQGAIVADLQPGQYKLSAVHNGVTSPNDPRRPPVAYNYGKITLVGESTPSANIGFAMPNAPYTSPDGVLTLTNPNDAKCP